MYSVIVGVFPPCNCEAPAAIHLGQVEILHFIGEVAGVDVQVVDRGCRSLD